MSAKNEQKGRPKHAPDDICKSCQLGLPRWCAACGTLYQDPTHTLSKVGQRTASHGAVAGQQSSSLLKAGKIPARMPETPSAKALFLYGRIANDLEALKDLGDELDALESGRPSDLPRLSDIQIGDFPIWQKAYERIKAQGRGVKTRCSKRRPKDIGLLLQNIWGVLPSIQQLASAIVVATIVHVYVTTFLPQNATQDLAASATKSVVTTAGKRSFDVAAGMGQALGDASIEAANYL